MKSRDYIFSTVAEKQFGKFPKQLQSRIINKLDYFCESGNPLRFAKKLINHKIGERRFRIGEYRVICDVNEEGKLIIVALIGHRKDIYE